MKFLSRSIPIMFFFDLMIFISFTVFWCRFFDLGLDTGKAATILIVIAGMFTFYLKSHYQIREIQINYKTLYLLIEGIFFAHVPAAVLLFFFAKNINSLEFLLTNFITVLIAFVMYRLAFQIYLSKFKKTKNVLVLGENERSRVVADLIESQKALKMNVKALVKKIDEYDKIEDIDIVILAEFDETIINIPQNIKIYKMVDFYEMVTGRFYIDEDNINALSYDLRQKSSLLYDFCKRIYDIIAALIILIVTLPITAGIALAVKLTDGESPFFTQTRAGKNGKPFECYKLRTMYTNDYVPENDEQIKYGEKDDRVIPFCKFVRKARFDEIPQMINILKGEMSIVGPRAEWIEEVKIFYQKIEHYSCRLWVKAGWTGWSHINMLPVLDIEGEKERLSYDLYYIKHRNIFWEIGILVKAVFLALGGRHK